MLRQLRGACSNALPRRSFSTALISSRVAFPADRIPVLEEIFETPVLRTEEMRAESLAEVKGFVPPALMSQIETSLTHEFGQPILETDWERYEDPTRSHEQAAKLIHNTLAIYSNVGKGESMKAEEVKALGELNQAWVREECKKLLEEIRTGSYERWELAELNAGPQFTGLTPKQQAAVRPAIAIISKNAWLHPKTKGEVIGEICRVVASTIKE